MTATTPRIKLLAIDDDPQSLELVSEALSGDGLDILTAEIPSAAWNWCASSAPPSC